MNNLNPYHPPCHSNDPASASIIHSAVRWCVGAGSVIHAVLLIPAIEYLYRGAGMKFIKQNQANLISMSLAAMVGGVATICVRQRWTWRLILMLWVPLAMYPVSTIKLPSWPDEWDLFQILAFPVLPFLVVASLLAYALTAPSRRSSKSDIGPSD